MNPLLGNKNPLEILGFKLPDSLSDKEVDDFIKALNKQLTEYLLIRFAEDLSDSQLEEIAHIKDVNKLDDYLNNNISNLEEKRDKYLQDFKEKYTTKVQH